MADLKNTIHNDILCYITSAMGTLTRDSLITCAFGFYKPDEVKKAKDLICKLANEKNIARKSCTGHPNPMMADLKDIYSCFEKIENDSMPTPKFVAGGFSSFPPQGFENVAPIMCSLRDEICALREELNEMKQNNANDARALNNYNVVAQDVTEIKAFVQRLHAIHGSPPQSVQNMEAGLPNTDASSIKVSNEVSSAGITPTNATPIIDNSGNDTENDWHLVNHRHYANAARRGRGAGNFRTSARGGGNVAPGTRGDAQQNSRSGNGANSCGADNESSVPRGNDGQGNRRRRREVITGCRTSESDISAGDRIVDIFVGGCGQTCTSEKITDFCVKYGIPIRKCEELKSASEWVKSFKVSATFENREKLLDGNFWPQGVFVRKFFRRRINNGSN